MSCIKQRPSNAVSAIRGATQLYYRMNNQSTFLFASNCRPLQPH